MHYKCTTSKHIGVGPTHVGLLQCALMLCTCSAFVVILTFSPNKTHLPKLQDITPNPPNRQLSLILYWMLGAMYLRQKSQKQNKTKPFIHIWIIW
jgi:hypothetical protein